jgi:hypothetical protein
MRGFRNFAILSLLGLGVWLVQGWIVVMVVDAVF